MKKAKLGLGNWNLFFVVYLVIGIWSLGFVLVGCGNHPLEPQGKNEIVAKNPNNPKLADLSAKLGTVKDEATALEAVNVFADYVISKLDKNIPGNEGVKGCALSDTLRAKFAKVETAARLKMAGLSAAGADEKELVSPQKLEAVLEDVQSDSGGVAVTASQISSTQKVLREAVPNLASTDSNKMTPLEASIITYHMMTGDDGSDSGDALPLQASVPKVNEFADKLIEVEEVK
jgi:hypothetical protein